MNEEGAVMPRYFAANKVKLSGRVAPAARFAAIAANGKVEVAKAHVLCP